jgi:hypothetical protein
MRLNFRLVDASDGRQIASEQIEQPWGELFALQTALASQVAFRLRERLGQEIALRENRGETKSYAAWETTQLAGQLARRAVDYSLRRVDTVTPYLLLQADSLYARAESLDPDWVLPTIRRGTMAAALATQAIIPSQRTPPPGGSDAAAYRQLRPIEQHEAWLLRALEHADAAVRRSPRSAHALALRGDVRATMLTSGIGEPDTLALLAERDLRAAVAIRPDLAAAWSALATVFRYRGLNADAADAAKRAFEADAFFETRKIVSVGLFASLMAEQFDDARRWCRHGLTHYAGDPRFTECELTVLGWTGQSRSDATKAWQLLTTIEQRDTVGMLAAAWGFRRLMVASVLARAGLGDSARNVLSQVQTGPSTDPSRRSTVFPEARVMLLLGDKEAALRRLSEYLQTAPHQRPRVAEHPWFRPLRDDPRFAAMVGPTP